MATSTTIVCTGVLDVSVSPPSCSVPWISVDTGLGFDVSQLDPGAVVGAFAAGAVIVFPAFALAWGIVQVVKSLR